MKACTLIWILLGTFSFIPFSYAAWGKAVEEKIYSCQNPETKENCPDISRKKQE